MTEKTYLYVGDHADTLSGGRRVNPGDRVPASAVDPKDPHDDQLLDDELLIHPAEAKKEANA